MKTIIVYITCFSFSQAKKIASHLLSLRLVACANIVPKIHSLYLWKGKIAKQNESLLLCKTTKKFTRKIKKEVKEKHSYETPCIEFIEVFDQNKEYAKWLEKELQENSYA